MDVSRKVLISGVFLILIIGLMGAVRATGPKPSPNLAFDDYPSTTVYVVKTDGLGMYWMTDSTGHDAFWDTNQTLVEQYALGNMTTGLLFLQGISHNSSLTVPAGVTVEQDSPVKFFSSTGSSSLPDCPSNVTSSFTLTSDTTEHTIFTITPTSSERLEGMTFDFSNLTQNCTICVYVTLGGSYVKLDGMTVTVTAGSHGVPWHPYYDFNTPLKVTIQSVVAEGVSRTVNYQYWLDVF